MSARATRKPDRAGLEEAGPVAPRGRGRPRSEEAHRAILAAVIDLLGEQGLNGLTMEAVAARAGVGKTTIYRRWSNKNDLVVEAIEQLPPSGSLPDQGSLLGDLKAMVALQRERLDASQLPASCRACSERRWRTPSCTPTSSPARSSRSARSSPR